MWSIDTNENRSEEYSSEKADENQSVDSCHFSSISESERKKLQSK